MGNVSYVVPSIHPMYYIGSDAFNHTREFNTATGIMFVCVKEKFDISLPIVKFLLAIHVVFSLWKLTTFVSPYITITCELSRHLHYTAEFHGLVIWL